MFRSVHGQCSKNLELKFKSNSSRALLETRGYKTQYGRRTFTYAGPRLWNALPLSVRQEKDINNFKKQVKTILFEGTDKLLEQAFMKW